MRALANLLISIIIAGWVAAIAILSVQNATPVTLKFLNYQTVQLPIGLVLAFSVSGGIVGMTLLQPFRRLGGGGNRFQDDVEEDFYVDEPE